MSLIASPMACSFASNPYSPLFTTSSTPCPAITKDEIYAFHSIDRNLFTRLVLELECNKRESLRVMTLWIWLERASLSPVVYTVLKFPDPKLQALFDEALLCLKLVDGELSTANFAGDAELPLIKSIARKMDINCPKFFVDNRTDILSGMEKAFQDVCAKAFDDIIEKASKPSGDLVLANAHDLLTMVSDVFKVKEVNAPMPVAGALQTESTIIHSAFDRPGSTIDSVQDEVTEMLRRMRLGIREEADEIVLPPDERTIFLTFSKGYPIPEKEVEDFFTRLLGDLVQQVRMQDVAKDEQPLYARLVLRDPRAICKILGGQSKAKFSINGKHVWARRYVHKTGKSTNVVPCTTVAEIAMPLI